MSDEKRIARRRFLAAAAGIAGALVTTQAEAKYRGYCAKPPPRSNIPKGHKPPGPIPCFLQGTLILTDKGSVPVQTLSEGDLVVTSSGALKPIRWIGTTAHDKQPGQAWDASVMPIRVARGAIDPEMPNRDLYLSPEHALYIDGVLVPVKFLVNGTTIAPATPDMSDRLDYYHLELDAHDVVYAEGMAAETFRDTGSRELFENAAETLGTQTSNVVTMPFAPVLGYYNRRSEVASHLRSAVSPWYDRRTQLEVIRDRLNERAYEIEGTTMAPGVSSSRAA